MAKAVTTIPTEGNPRKNADAAFEAFMSMPDDEWRGVVMSLVNGGVLEVEESKGFERAMKARSTANENLASLAMTTIPATEQAQTVVFSVTQETIRRFEGYRDLRVLDINDKGQLKAVHDARMELVKARTSVDKTRKEMNDDHQREIKLNNEKAKGLLSLFEPIEMHLKSEEDRVEAAIEAERVVAKNAKIATRKQALAEIVGEFTDMLSIFSDDVLFGMGEKEYADLTGKMPVQVSVRRAAAEAARVAKEAADKAAKEQQEREAAAEVERLKQQAIEDAARKAAQDRLDAERAEFEKLQREAAAKQAEIEAAKELEAANRRAEELAVLAQQRAEIEIQRMALEDAQRKQDAIRVAAELEAKRKADEAAEAERLRIKAEQDAEDARVRAAEEARIAAERKAREEAMRPDVEKMHAWITAIEDFASEQFPAVSDECEPLLTECNRDLTGAIDAMRTRLT